MRGTGCSGAEPGARLVLTRELAGPVGAQLLGDPDRHILAEPRVEPVGAHREDVEDREEQERGQVGQVPVGAEEGGRVVPEVLRCGDGADEPVEVPVQLTHGAVGVAAVHPCQSRKEPEEQEELQADRSGTDDLAPRPFILKGLGDSDRTHDTLRSESAKPKYKIIIFILMSQVSDTTSTPLR